MTEDNPILRFFTWWNDAMADTDMLTPDNFARFFAEDGQLIVNGNLRATGPEELTAHYHAIADRLDHVEMILPVEEAFANNDRAFVHCRTCASADGRQSAEEAMAYAIMDGPHMRLLRVVSLSV